MALARYVVCVGMVFGVLACAPDAAPSPQTQQFTPEEIARAIRATVDSDDLATGPALAQAQREQLRALYGKNGDSPLWVDGAGCPTRDANDALALLRNARDEGLDPSDYGSASLDSLAATLKAEQARPIDRVAWFETVLSAATLRYLRHLHSGRVDPRDAGFRMNTPRDEHDFVALLAAALAGSRLTAAAADLAPPLVLYRSLRSGLARYRSLAADPAIDGLLPSVATVRPGERYEGLLMLHLRLVAIGDLPADVPAPSEPLVYEGAVVEGVKHFQLRHGLAPDGVLGDRTQAALRVPLAARVRQIELALERLRWLPHLGDRPFVAVNIPMFHLWAWDSIPADGSPSFDVGVIVGRALNTQTPVFVEEMRSVIFRPYWNIPPSIVRGEILPALERDPDYLQRQEMEIVSGQGDDARPVPVNAENIARLRQGPGSLRVRQRPGPRNALGLVKFVFPNDENVYMHGTPAPQLFSRSRRDFSHGCIRLEDPVAFAEWVLKDQSEWTRDRILAAMQGSDSHRVELRQPIQVILFYITAVVMPEDQTIRFAEDIYRHDAKLERALSRATP